MIAIALSLSGCGGGGSGGPTPTGTGDSPGEESPSGSPPADEDTPSPGVGTTDGGASDDPGSRDPDRDDVDTSIGGRTLRVIATDQGPAIGVPDAIVDFPRSPEVHPTGFLAYSGLYRSTVSDDVHYAVWAGPVSDPQLLVREGLEVDGLPSSVRFRLAQDIRLGSDGSGAMIALLEGARETTAVLAWTDEGLHVVAESDTRIDPARSTQVVEEFQAISRSAAGTLMAVRNADFSVTIWSDAEGELAPVIGDGVSGLEQASQIDGCHVAPTDSRRTEDTSGPVLLDSGDIVFQASMTNFAGQSGCPRIDLVARHEAGRLVAVVREEDAVPGSPNWTFGSPILLRVLPNGDALVLVLLDSEELTDQLWSLWLFPVDGAPRLIALEREEIEIGASVETLSTVADYELDAADADHVALRVVFEGPRLGTVLLGGAPHPGQPHAALEAPGAASLESRVDASTSVPGPNGGSSYFGAIDRPAIDRLGRITFYGSVSDAAIDERLEDGIWQVAPDGELQQLLGEEDTVTVGGGRRGAMSLVSSSLGRAPDEFLIEPLDDGGLIIYGAAQTFTNRAIIHMAP